MASSIDIKKIRDEISPAFEQAIKEKAIEYAKDVLNENLNSYIEEIENHPISKELNAGPDGENISNTLNGQENLFAFIGFDEVDEPIKDLKNLIKQNTFLSKNPKFDKKTFELKYDVYTPSLEEIRSETPLPFEKGRSWVKGVEDGISGFGYYVYGILFKNSRSGRGIQSKNKIRSTAYRPISYMSELYRNFVKGLK
jgi:hypothetical protein